MRVALALVSTATLLSACGQAQAAQIDPENDLHCAALAIGFRIAAERNRAPKDQGQAIAFVDAHFSKKIREAALKSDDPDRLLASAKPIVDLIEKDLLATKKPMMQCVDRAIKEAGLSR